jgi:transcriptional regulator with XRE-family HTH domain
MKVVKQLLRIRRKMNLRPCDVARRMGVSRQRVYNIETGRIAEPKLSTLEKYARAVGATIEVSLRAKKSRAS